MSRIGILTTDTGLVVKTWDPSLEAMTGISADSARGQRLEDVVPTLKHRALVELIREPLVSGSAQVLAPAIHKFLIPCAPLTPSNEFDQMQQRVVVGALHQRAAADPAPVRSVERIRIRSARAADEARRASHQAIGPASAW